MKLYRRIMRFIGRTCEEERQAFRREVAHLNATGEDMHRTIVTNAAALREAVLSLPPVKPKK